MRNSVTQEFEYGCGVACYAFARQITYKEAVVELGKEQSVKHGWKPSDIVTSLHNQGLMYKNKYVRKLNDDNDYPTGTIVLIERSSDYPVGHYLIKYIDSWMDPWINLSSNNTLSEAKSGFRDKLPGKAMYAIVPTQY